MGLFKRTTPAASQLILSPEADIAYVRLLNEYETELQEILYEVFTAGCEMGMMQDNPDRHALANQRLRSAQLQMRELNVSVLAWKESALVEPEVPLFEEIRQMVRSTMLEKIAQDLDNEDTQAA